MSGTERLILGELRTDEPNALIDRFSKLVRLSGTAEEREAMNYVMERLTHHGVPFTLHEPVCFISLPVKAELKVLGANGYEVRAKTPAMSLATGDTPVTGELVYVPTSPARSISEIFGGHLGTDVDLKGKVLLTEGFPMPGKVAAARAAGAAGAIFIAPGERIHEGICTDIWGSPDLDSAGRQPDLPVLAINRPDGMRLAEAAKAGGLNVSLRTWLDTGWRPIPVLEVEIKGTEKPDEFVLYHGHLDSWHVGIGDNATGNAALLEIARTFWKHRKELKRSLRVVWWSGHSHGRYAGSTWYADAHARELAENCVLHVNCDSPGCRWATDYSGAMMMAEAVALGGGAIADAVGQQGVTGKRPLRAGDNSFTNLGLSTCFMQLSWMPEPLLKEKGYYPVGGNGGNIEWHAEDDETHLYDPEVQLNDMKVFSLAILRALNSELHPLDYRATVAELQAAAKRWQDAAGDRFDFAPIFAEAESLVGELSQLYARVDEIGADRANAALRAVGRQLVSLLYAKEAAHKQDRALELPPLPDLAYAPELATAEVGSARYHLIRTQLVRGQNRVVAGLAAARKEVARA